MLRVGPELFERYPGVRVGTVVARDVDNAGRRPELDEWLRTEERRVRERLAGKPLIEHPAIACWRDAYRGFGAKPKKYPSSIEALVRRVLKGEPVPAINPLVDLYNVVSLRHLLPVGGEDLDTLEGPLELRFATEHEPAVTLLGRPEPQAPVAGEVIYSDRAGAVCRRWNWREAARTRLRPETRRAILVVESLPPTAGATLVAALGDLEELITRLCGARCETSIHEAGFEG